MIDDRGQLAVAGGRLNSSAEPLVSAEPGIIFWIRQHVTPAATLGFADRHRRWLWGTVLLFYIAAFNGQWRIQPDAALYLAMGRNLATGHGYTYLGQTNNLAYPGWPLLIAGCFKIFGVGSLLAVNALLTAIALATLLLVYRLFLLACDRPTAVVISVGVGLTKAFFCYAFELWSDMPFALGVMAALAGYEAVFGLPKIPSGTRAPGSNPPAAEPASQAGSPGRRQRSGFDFALLVGGLVFAAAIRPTIWPLLAAFAITLTIQAAIGRIHWRTYAWLAGVSLLALAIVAILATRYGWSGYGHVYQEYLLNRLSGKSDDFLSNSLSANIRNLFDWAASDVLFQARLGPGLNSILSLIVLGLGFGLFRFRLLWGFWFCFLLAAILASQETLDRYFLPVLPLLVFGWWQLLLWLYRTGPQWTQAASLPRSAPSIAFGGLLAMGCMMNVAKVGGIVYQQHQRPFLENYDKGVQDVTPQFARALQQSLNDKALVLAKTPYGRVLEYLSNRCVTGAAAASPEELRTRPVYVVEPSDLGTQRLLREAHLVEEPAILSISPPPGHGPEAVTLSLHPTHLK
jgi:hypothetical protein